MNSILSDQIFRAYDIRGIYPSEINEEVFFLLGKAIGTKICATDDKRVNVCMDGRLSSNSLKENLIKGIISVGVDVICVSISIISGNVIF